LEICFLPGFSTYDHHTRSLSSVYASLGAYLPVVLKERQVLTQSGKMLSEKMRQGETPVGDVQYVHATLISDTPGNRMHSKHTALHNHV
jgi:hypothetical protein